VRAGHFAWGCATTSGLVAGTTSTVKVNIVDKPLVASEADLDLTFTMKVAEKPFGTIMAEARTSLLDRFAAEGVDLGPTLLDEMQARLAATDATLFDEARATFAWDAVATNHLASLPTSLRGAIEGFLVDTPLAPAELTGRLTAISKVPGYGMFTVTQLGVVPAHEAGIPGIHLVEVGGAPSDTLNMAASLFWLPTRYLGGVCTASALTGAPEGATMGDALSAAAGCDALGQALVGFGACDASCLAGLCQEALEDRWDVAQDGSALEGKIGELRIAAGGSAEVDDVAVPVKAAGAWLGSISDGVIVAPIDKSTFTATMPVELAPEPAPEPAP